MLREAGSRIVATAITIILRRLVSGRNDDRGNYHRRVEPLGVPNGFMQLFNAINAAIDEPFRSKSLKTPHITISYRAPSAFAPRVISPVAWNIEELLLVEGGGDPYHYKVLDRWALRPIAPNPQLELGF